MSISLDPNTLYDKFLETSMRYGARNDVLASESLFFRGIQWEEQSTSDDVIEDDRSKEFIRITRNYTRLTVMKQAAYLTGKRPRVDVPRSSVGLGAPARERYLRSLLGTLWPVWVSSIEVDASKCGYGILQVMWFPPDGSVVASTAPDAVQTQQRTYTQVPFKFRSIAPTRFFPIYNTYDEPDDFHAVFVYEPSRLVEDLEDRYGVKLQPTQPLPGTMGTCEVVEYWTKTDYVLMAITQQRTDLGVVEAIPHILKQESHRYGRLPFFLVQNIIMPHEDPTVEGSVSDVELVKDANKDLNLLWSMYTTEALTRMRPPTVYHTDSPTYQPNEIKMGSGDVIPLRTDEDLKPIVWDGIPTTVYNLLGDTMSALSDFGSLPRSEFGSDGNASGVGMKLAYGNLELCLALKVPIRVAALEHIFSFCLKVTESKLGKNGIINFLVKGSTVKNPLEVNLLAKDIGGRLECNVTYPSLLPRDKISHEQHVVYLFNAHVISHLTALEMIEDIDDPEAELDRVRKEFGDSVLFPDRVMQTSQAKQPEAPAPGQPTPSPQDQLQLRMNSAPPVPTSPEMPTGRNTPYLSREPVGNFDQMFNRNPGVYQGPPIEEMV